MEVIDGNATDTRYISIAWKSRADMNIEISIESDYISGMHCFYYGSHKFDPGFNGLTWGDECPTF
jgi:hypothetical protein